MYYRSPWAAAGVAAAALLAAGLAGLLTEGIPSPAPAVLVLLLVPALLFARAAGRVRGIDWRSNGSCSVRGGLRGVSIDVSEFAWVRCYRTIRRETTDGGVVVVLYRTPARRPFAKVFGEFFPTVSRRRATVVIASGWFAENDRRRVSAAEMERELQQACRRSGLVIQHHDGLLSERRWTAERPRPADQAS